MKKLNTPKAHRGIASLVMAVVLLVVITALTLLTAKTVLQETKIAANNYRAAQALSAANAGMDYAVAYFDNGGFDQVDNGDGSAGSDDVVDVLADLSITSSDGSQALKAEIVLINTDTEATPITVFGRTIDYSCINTPGTMKSGMIMARGYSDDDVAERLISQCVGTIDVFGGNGPKQALISRGIIGLTGNYRIINRFNNTTTWSGDDFEIGNSASASTHIRPPGTKQSDFTRAQLEDDGTGNSHTSEAISDRKKGTGLDAIANDPRLGNLTGDAFFNNFFFTDKAGMKEKAIAFGTYFTGGNIGSADGESGIIWIEGNASISGGTIGAADNPAIFIINGNLTTTGGFTVYGMLYVIGQYDAKGTPNIYGSAVVEGDSTMVPAGEDAVVGHGTVRLVYTPFTLDQAKNPLKGLTTIVNGTWRDW